MLQKLKTGVFEDSKMLPRKSAASRKPARSDEYWMRVALDLAPRGRFEVSPNPMVGACLVRKGKLVGQGWHQRFGGPHAEVKALRQAGKRAQGAVLYVTLEPCSSWGKTPPCVEALIQAGLREVVFAARDPNPKHQGRASAILKKAGIRVRGGCLAREAEKQNETFFKWIRTRRPFVTLKMAQTLDGKIATRSGRSRWISSPESRALVQTLRRSHDAVLVGKKTMLLDNPSLSVRNSHETKPWKVILDPKAEVSVHAKVFSGSQGVVLVLSEKALTKASRIGWKKPLTLITVREVRGQLDLGQLLDKLGELGVASLLVEGGGETAWTFLAQGLVDRVIWITAPKFFGGRNAKTSVEGEGVLRPDQALHLKQWSFFPCGKDLVLEGRF